MKERFDKLGALWSSLSPSRKFTLVGAVVGILALSAGILVFSGGSTQMRVLVSGAEAKEAVSCPQALNADER